MRVQITATGKKLEARAQTSKEEGWEHSPISSARIGKKSYKPTLVAHMEQKKFVKKGEEGCCAKKA